MKFAQTAHSDANLQMANKIDLDKTGENSDIIEGKFDANRFRYKRIKRTVQNRIYK